MKKTFTAVALAIILVVITVAFSSPVLALNKVPSWAVCQETMASGETWYAYAKGDIRQFKSLQVGDQVWLNSKAGIFQAEIVKILEPVAASNPRKPTRVWIEFKSTNQSESNLAVIFKRWGSF